MKLWKYLLVLASVTLLFFILSGCQQKEVANTIKVGTIAGPETQLMEVAKQVAAKKYGLNIQIVQFTDYNMPNEALADHSINANMFQHIPYLDAAIKAKAYKIVAIGKTFIYPMGLYSKKITRLSQLQTGATIAIPNDPSNEARALLLLQQAGLITLNKNTGTNVSLQDIVDNPKDLKIQELDAAQIPRVLPDVTLAAINTNYAMLANLLPSRDALVVESPDSPYANIVAVNQDQQNDPRFKQLIAALHSPEVLAEAKKLFKGQAIPAWK